MHKLKPSNHILNINVIPTNKGYLVLIREAACISDFSIDGEKHYDHSNLRKSLFWLTVSRGEEFLTPRKQSGARVAGAAS